MTYLDKANQRFNEGVRLSEQRDSGKRKFENMSATEQQILEDFETGKAAKRHAEDCGKKQPCFRGKML